MDCTETGDMPDSAQGLWFADLGMKAGKCEIGWEEQKVLRGARSDSVAVGGADAQAPRWRG